MIGSPDVLSFTKEDEYGDSSSYPDPWALPAEFSDPHFPHNVNTNPWAKTSYAKFTKDFILISEFSEQVGPQPLLTIPDDPKVCGTFDLNYFSLRIMSVDYQASFVGHPPGSGYPRLSFVEDSRVVLGDSKEGAFAYVHHLTLYDLEARGFVRPFCMAYVSADERKIMLQFQELSLRFSQASECLKIGNRQAFARELRRKLRDLEYTRSVLQKEEGLQREAGPQSCYSAHVVEKANELASVEKSIFEHRDLLRQICSYPQRQRRDPNAVTCPRCTSESEDTPAAPPNHNLNQGGRGEGEQEQEEEGQEEDGRRRPSYTPQLIKAKSAKCFDKRLKTLQELCDQTFFEATAELLRETEKSFRGDLCYLHTRRLDRALRRKQRIINFLFEEDPGEEEEEEGGSVRPFCAVNHALDTDTPTAVRLPPILLSLDPETLELDPAPELSHAQESVPASGRARLESSPSDQTLDTQESSEETKGSFSSEKSLTLEGQGDGEGDGEGDKEGEDSPASLNTHHPGTKLTLDRSLTPDTDPDLERKSGREEGRDGDDQTPCGEGTEEGSTSGETDPGSLVQMDTACCMSQEGFLFDASVPDSVPGLGLGAALQPPQSLVVNQEPQALLPVQGDYAVGSPRSEGAAVGLAVDGLSRCSAAGEDGGSDCTMSGSAGSDLGYGGVATLRQRKRAGQGALRFVRQYPFATQALWCVLSGRTLVVLGADEGRVRRLVAALALFIPGPGRCGERVQPWLSCPFTLTHLHRWKLIGLQRMASPVGCSMLCSLSRYGRYLSVLDVDHKTLRCPPYRGQLLANMADHRTYIRRGSTYFLHVQSTLTALAAKAFLFTFTHHLHLPISPGEGPEGVGARRRSFLQDQLGLGEDDSRILLYLSQLITQQYLQPPAGGAAVPSFSFNYITSVLYKI